MDTLDRLFVSYLKEIERSYIGFPKQIRIRIEKWITKLANVGRNPVWRKNRNNYAKLLLNMVVIKSLTEPFHIPPSDDPLPTLPAYLLGRNYKDLMGPHESSFWRETYELLSLSKHQESMDLTQSEHYIEKKDLTDEFHDKYMEYKYNYKNQSPSSSGLDREVDDSTSNLKRLILEQQQQLKALLEQLTHERLKHEIELQQIIKSSSRQSSDRFDSTTTFKSHQAQVQILLNQSNQPEESQQSSLTIKTPSSLKDTRFNEENGSNIVNTVANKSLDLLGGEAEFLNYLEEFQHDLKLLQLSDNELC